MDLTKAFGILKIVLLVVKKVSALIGKPIKKEKSDETPTDV